MILQKTISSVCPHVGSYYVSHTIFYLLDLLALFYIFKIFVCWRKRALVSSSVQLHVVVISTFIVIFSRFFISLDLTLNWKLLLYWLTEVRLENEVEFILLRV